MFSSPLIPESPSGAHQRGLGSEDLQPPERRGNGETVLIVDDEQTVILSFRILLELQGFKVIAASDGQQALNCYQQHGAEIRLVITDLLMPNLDGAGLIQALRQLNPGLPIIVVSGNGTQWVPGGSENLGVIAFLDKPFNSNQLIEAVYKAMEIH